MTTVVQNVLEAHLTAGAARFLREPHGQQQLALDADEKEQLYGGAKRGGKTVWLGMKAAMLSYFFPGNKGLLARKVLGDVIATTLDEFFRTVPSELAWSGSWEDSKSWNKGEKLIRLKTIDPKTPSVFFYRGLGEMTKADEERVKSLTLGWFGIDEPTEVYEKTYLQLLAQLTHILPDGTRPPYMALLASNPEPGWVKRRFIIEKVPGSIFIPALPRDNPFLPPNWEDDLRKGGYDADWIERYLAGSWDVSEGLVFTMYDDRTHTVTMDQVLRAYGCQSVSDLRKHLTLYAAIDHAMSGITACVIVGVDRWGNEIVLSEYYERNMTISQHVSGIKAMFYEFGWPKVVLIDPSTVAKTLQGAKELESVQDEYSRQGIPTVLAWNKIEVGINSIKEMMAVVPEHMNPFTGLSGSPAVFFVKERTQNLRDEILEFRKELKPDAKGVKWIGRDHALDCYRYIRNHRPRRPVFVDKNQFNKTIQEVFAQRAHSRWARGFDRRTRPVRNLLGHVR